MIYGQTECNPSILTFTMLSVIYRDSIWIFEDRSGLLKADTVLFLVLSGFVWVPLKDIIHNNALSTKNIYLCHK